MDEAPSPGRFRREPGGDRVVGFLVVGSGVLVRRRAPRNHLAAGHRADVLLPVVGPVARGRLSGHVRAVVNCAQVLSKRLGWLTAANQCAR